MNELYDGIMQLQQQMQSIFDNLNNTIEALNGFIEMCGLFAKCGIAAIIILLVLVVSVLARQNQIERKIDDLSEEIKSLNKYISGGE